MILCQSCQRPAEANLCATCAGQLARALGDLPALLSALSGVVARQAKLHRTSGPPREADEDWRGGEHALIRTAWAINPDASAELDRVGNELAGWVRHLCETAAVDLADVPVRQRTLHIERNRIHALTPGQDIGCAQWLHQHLDAITLDEAAGEILDEITQLRADLARAVDNSPTTFYAGPCHASIEEPTVSVRNGTVYLGTAHRRCQRDLYAWVNPWGPGARDDTRIVCKGWRSEDEGCGTVHTVASRQDWLLDSIEDALQPLEVWRRALPAMIDTLTWPRGAWWDKFADPTKPRRLQPKSVADGVELFRGGDLRELVERDQARIVASQTREKVRKVMR